MEPVGSETKGTIGDSLPGAFKKSPSYLFAVAAVLTALIGAIDYLTGPELGFFVFYFLPVGLVAWYAKRHQALVMAGLCTAVWLWVEWVSEPHISWWGFRAWNGCIRGVTFSLISILVARIRTALEVEQQLNVQLTQHLQEVQELLPICAGCKRIRNDQGYWEQVEAYFNRHTGVEFTHGMCPKCMKEYYPEFYDQLQEE